MKESHKKVQNAQNLSLVALCFFVAGLACDFDAIAGLELGIFGCA